MVNGTVLADGRRRFDNQQQQKQQQKPENEDATGCKEGAKEVAVEFVDLAEAADDMAAVAFDVDADQQEDPVFVTRLPKTDGKLSLRRTFGSFFLS